MRISEKILLAILLAALTVVISGTVFGLSTGSRSLKLKREAILEKIQAAGLAGAPGITIFEGIGKIRAHSADTRPVLIAAQIVIPYDQGDRALREELFSKKDKLRKAAIDYFTGKRAAELLPASENAIKAGLRDSINAQLSLGKISELYLPQFDIIP